MKSIYLAGPLDYADLGVHTNWRDRLRSILTYHLEEDAPMTYSPGDPYSDALQDVKALVAINMAAVGACDALVAAVFPTMPSWGTPIEIYEARRQGKPVLLWVPGGVCPPYLQDGTEQYTDMMGIALRIVDLVRDGDQNDYGTTSGDLLYENGGIHYPKVSGDVGYDVECMETTMIRMGHMEQVPLGFNGEPLRIKAPRGSWFSIYPRSSIAKRGLMVIQTVIDEGYTGDMFCFMYNASREAVTIKKGSRIGQVVVFDARVPQLRQVAKLPSTARGSDGFGSTGA